MPTFTITAPYGTKFGLYLEDGAMRAGIMFTHGNEDRVREGLLSQLEPEKFFEFERRRQRILAERQEKQKHEEEARRNIELAKLEKKKEEDEKRRERIEAAKDAKEEATQIAAENKANQEKKPVTTSSNPSPFLVAECPECKVIWPTFSREDLRLIAHGVKVGDDEICKGSFQELSREAYRENGDFDK